MCLFLSIKKWIFLTLLNRWRNPHMFRISKWDSIFWDCVIVTEEEKKEILYVSTIHPLTNIGRSAIEGITLHHRGPSDNHTGERRAVGEGKTADISHGWRDRDGGKGVAGIKGITFDSTHRGRDRYEGEGGAGEKGILADDSHRSRDGDWGEGGAGSKGIIAEGSHRSWDR